MLLQSSGAKKVRQSLTFTKTFSHSSGLLFDDALDDVADAGGACESRGDVAGDNVGSAAAGDLISGRQESGQVVIFGHVIAPVVGRDNDVSDDLPVTAAVSQPAFLAGDDDQPAETKITRVGKLAGHHKDAAAAAADLTTSFTKCDTRPVREIARIVRKHDRRDPIRR